MFNTIKLSILFIGACILFSCSTLKTKLSGTLKKTIISDTSYFTLDIPIKTSREDLYDLWVSLESKGYIKQIGFWRFHRLPYYSLTDKSQNYVRGILINPLRDSEQIAMFNYYRINSIRLNHVSLINSTKDTAFAMIRVDYTVSPLFTVKENPKYVQAVFTKKESRWTIIEPLKIFGLIYRNEDDEYKYRLIFHYSMGYKKAL